MNIHCYSAKPTKRLEIVMFIG